MLPSVASDANGLIVALLTTPVPATVSGTLYAPLSTGNAYPGGISGVRSSSAVVPLTVVLMRGDLGGTKLAV